MRPSRSAPILNQAVLLFLLSMINRRSLRVSVWESALRKESAVWLDFKIHTVSPIRSAVPKV